MIEEIKGDEQISLELAQKFMDSFAKISGDLPICKIIVTPGEVKIIYYCKKCRANAEKTFSKPQLIWPDVQTL